MDISHVDISGTEAPPPCCPKVLLKLKQFDSDSGSIMWLYQVTGCDIYWDSCKATLVSTSGVENEHRSAGMIEVMKKD